jgi:hypothetical protein
MSTDFYDLYVPFTMNGDLEEGLERRMMYSVFNLITNTERNRRGEGDPKNWELTTRFFLVDRLAGVTASQSR